MSQHQLNQVFEMANEARAGEQFQKSADYYSLLISKTQLRIDDVFQLTVENLHHTRLYFEANKGLACSLYSTGKFEKAEKMILTGMEKLNIIISNAGIPMAYRAFMLTAYKDHFYALAWIYQEGNVMEKLLDYVWSNAANLDNWKVNVSMFKKHREDLN